MFSRRAESDAGGHRHVITEPGISLAKGPASLLGLALAAVGLLGLLRNASFTALSDFPNGQPVGTQFAGIEMNGWTNWITVAAGVLLLFGAAAHVSAKLMSFIIGGALIACAVLGAVRGDVLGLAASNWLTEVLWAAVGVALLANAFAPRRVRSREVNFPDPVRTEPAPVASSSPDVDDRAEPLVVIPDERPPAPPEDDIRAH